MEIQAGGGTTVAQVASHPPPPKADLCTASDHSHAPDIRTSHTPDMHFTHLIHTSPFPSHILLRHTSHTICTPEIHSMQSHRPHQLSHLTSLQGAKHKTREALAAPPAGIPGVKGEPDPSPDIS